MSIREKVAATVSATIVLASLVYWIIQIRAVMDVLKQAYG